MLSKTVLGPGSYCPDVSNRGSAPRLCTGPHSPAPGPAPQLVIIDTDIGDDIDDAFALALALRSPELRILGVTTAFRMRAAGRAWSIVTWPR